MDFFSALSAPFRLAGAVVGGALGLAGAAVGGALNLAGTVAMAPFALARSVFSPSPFFAGSEPVAFQLPSPEATQARVAEVTEQLKGVPRGYSVYTGAPPIGRASPPTASHPQFVEMGIPPSYPIGTRVGSDGSVISTPPTRAFNPIGQPPPEMQPQQSAQAPAAPKAPPPRQSAPSAMG